jgi:hypothetical protein
VQLGSTSDDGSGITKGRWPFDALARTVSGWRVIHPYV